MSDIAFLNGKELVDVALRTGINDVEAYIGYPNESDIVGLYADFESATYERIAGAKGKNAGSDYNVFGMYGNRRLCNLADNGTVNAWYGDVNYTEDGSNGQVMVYQPKFYYRVVPLKIEKIEPEVIDPEAATIQYTEPEGYHLLKANYFLSDTKKPGFKVHPAFLADDGVTEVNGIYISAYEGSIYDVSESKYLQYDDCDYVEGTYTAGVYAMDTTADKFSSVAGVKPASGMTNLLTRPNVEKLCQNRGSRWHNENYQVASMEQLLYVVENAGFNSQSITGAGLTGLASGSGNEGVNTGSTASFGNGSGRAASSTQVKSDGTVVTLTNTSQVSIRYRGRENDWGNMWDFVDGVNIYGNGKQRGGIAYYCIDHAYAESKNESNSDNYKSTGITCTSALNSTTAYGYIKRFGWSEKCDWAFIPTDIGYGADSTKPIGDYHYVTKNLNSYRIAYLGGSWDYSAGAGAFCWGWAAGVGGRGRIIGGRLFLV